MAALAAEVLKLVTVRAYWGLLAGAAVVMALGTTSTVSSPGATTNAALAEQQFFLIATTNLSLFAVVLGVKSFTDEFRHGTVTMSVLLHRRRARIVIAKVLVCCTAGGALAVVAQLVMMVLAWALGWSGSPDPLEDGRALLALVAGTAMWAGLGVALGGLVRHQVAAVVSGVVWVLLVENVGAGLLGGAGRWLPGQAVQSLIGSRFPQDLLRPATAAALLVLYVAAATAAAAISLRRRDLS